MKYCEDYAALLDAFADGECSFEEAEQVREHLTHCPGCRAYLRDLQQMEDAFPDWEDTPVPDGFADGVMAGLRADVAPRFARTRRWTKILVPLAACLAVVVLIRSLPSPNSAAGTAAASQESVISDTLDGADSSESPDSPAPEENSALAGSIGAAAEDVSSAPAPKSAPSSRTAPARTDSAGTADSKENAGTSQEATRAQSASNAGSSQEAGTEPIGSSETAPNCALTAPAGSAETADVPYLKSVTLTAQQAGTLLDAYEPEIRTDPLTGETQQVYALSEEAFTAIVQTLGAQESVCTESQDGAQLCRIIVTP